MDSNGSDVKPGFHWSTQSKLLIGQVEVIIKEFLPCPMDRIIAEVRYKTGLSGKKVSDIINIFVSRETVKFKLMKYKGKEKKCMVFSNE